MRSWGPPGAPLPPAQPIPGQLSCVHDGDRVEAACQNWCRIGADNILEDARVNRPKISIEFEIAVIVQIAQAGIRAVQAALNRITDDEHWLSRAVVGAVRAVLLDPPAELREGHDGYVVLTLQIAQILHERIDRIAQLAEQFVLISLLVGMGVEAAHAD